MTAVGQYVEQNVNGAALVEQPTPGPQGDFGSVDRPQNTPERKYRMIRLSAGDYLFPGNDGETIFRVAKYVEDGSLSDVSGDFWAAWYWPKPKSTLLRDPVYGYNPTEDWDSWHQIEDQFNTRQEAIDAALAWEWRRDNPVHDQPRRKPVDIASVVAAWSATEDE